MIRHPLETLSPSPFVSATSDASSLLIPCTRRSLEQPRWATHFRRRRPSFGRCRVKQRRPVVGAYACYFEQAEPYTSRELRTESSRESRTELSRELMTEQSNEPWAEPSRIELSRATFQAKSNSLFTKPFSFHIVSRWVLVRSMWGISNVFHIPWEPKCRIKMLNWLIGLSVDPLKVLGRWRSSSEILRQAQ